MFFNVRMPGLWVKITCGAGWPVCLNHIQSWQQAAEQYAYLKAASGTLLALNVAPADRILGLLCHTKERLDKAGDHFEEALAFCRRAPCRPELAWTCCDYADTLLQRRSTGDLVLQSQISGVK